jgi:hypothetical protein
MRNTIRMFDPDWNDEWTFLVAPGGLALGIFAFLALVVPTPLWGVILGYLYFGVFGIAVLGLSTHRYRGLSTDQKRALRQYDSLPEEVQKTIPNFEKMIRKTWSEMRWDEQIHILNMVADLAKVERDRQEVMRQVPAGYIATIEALDAARQDAKEHLEIVKEVQREMA